MFTPSDIVVLVLIVGSVILIWMARSSRSGHRDEESKPHTHETPPSPEQMEPPGASDHPAGHGQTEQKGRP